MTWSSQHHKTLAFLLCTLSLYFCSDSKKSAPPSSSGGGDVFGGETGIDPGISSTNPTPSPSPSAGGGGGSNNGLSSETLIFIKSHAELFAELLDNDAFKSCHDTKKKVYNWIKKTCTDVPLATSYTCDEAGAKEKFPDSTSLTTNLGNGYKVAQCGEKSASEPLILLIKKTETTASNGAPEVTADVKVHCYTSSDFCTAANWQP